MANFRSKNEMRTVDDNKVSLVTPPVVEGLEYMTIDNKAYAGKVQEVKTVSTIRKVRLVVKGRQKSPESVQEESVQDTHWHVRSACSKEKA
jgi:hypothetical protein